MHLPICIPETILPATCFVHAVTCKTDQKYETKSVNWICPYTYVPSQLHSKLNTWTHTSATMHFGHPGTRKTYDLWLREKYWWLQMVDKINTYMSSCSTCAQGKVPHNFPAEKLMPLPTPKCPWSHFALDFITDLSKSNTHTILLVVLYWFSRLLRLVPLPHLPCLSIHQPNRGCEQWQGSSIHVKGLELLPWEIRSHCESYFSLSPTVKWTDKQEV